MVAVDGIGNTGEVGTLGNIVPSTSCPNCCDPDIGGACFGTGARVGRRSCTLGSTGGGGLGMGTKGRNVFTQIFMYVSSNR